MDKILTYRQVRQIFSKEEIYDLVMYKLLTPIEKESRSQSWKFNKSDITRDLYPKLVAKRNEIQARRFDELLANEIEHEWKSKTR